jgi:hypothetical protein
LEVQAGNWTIKLNSVQSGALSRRRRREVASRSAPVFVSTFSSDKDAEPVRLEAYLSSNILDYDRGDQGIIVEAYVRRGYDSVLHARVEVRITSPTGEIMLLELLDNGSGADEEKDDGIYSRYSITHIELSM